jgi:hypothetical protein
MRRWLLRETAVILFWLLVTLSTLWARSYWTASSIRRHVVRNYSESYLWLDSRRGAIWLRGFDTPDYTGAGKRAAPGTFISFDEEPAKQDRWP